MSADHRQTAAAWHGGQSSPLYAYASTGAVLAGLDGEIEDCLAIVEHGELDIELDPVDEHQRLTALLHHVEPDLATARAERVGREHGHNAAGWWQQETLGGRATGDTAATAQRVLQGIEDGDPAVLDMAPGWNQIASSSEIMAEAEWPEPDVDDRTAHDRWVSAQPRTSQAYATAFVGAFWDAVAESCRTELADLDAFSGIEEPDGPYVRPVTEAATPPGWATEPIGRWRGHESEVVYDPRRVDVSVTRSASPSTASEVASAWQATGFVQHATDGLRGIWVRDRVAATRQALDRFHGSHPGVEHPAAEPAATRGLGL